MDFGRIFGALLNGAAQPPRRNAGRTTRRASGPFGMTQTETRQIGRALGALANIATEALAKSGQEPQPAKAPQPAKTMGAKTTSAPPPRRMPDIAPKPEPIPKASAEHAEARLLLCAMIAAARADGVIDRAERQGIAKQLDAAGLTAAERDEVLADFDNPKTVQELASSAHDPILRAQLYAAAFAAAGEVSAEERAWLDRLAGALKLQPAARMAIEQRLGE